MTYQLECHDCGFETVVDADVGAVYDAIEEHPERYEAEAAAHYVDFERVLETTGD